MKRVLLTSLAALLLDATGCAATPLPSLPTNEQAKAQIMLEATELLIEAQEWRAANVRAIELARYLYSLEQAEDEKEKP